LSHPFQFPRTPTAQRLATTILGPLRSDYAEQLEYESNWVPVLQVLDIVDGYSVEDCRCFT
jgi:hypothetical protein